MDKKCPKCNSSNIKQSGPYARIKHQGLPADKEPSPVYYHCWDCEYDWEINV